MTEQGNDMKIKAIVPAFGGKRTMGRDIAIETGKARAYWDLCSLSLATLFAREPTSHETVIDLHHHATNLAKVVQRKETAEELYDRLVRTLACEAIFEEAKAYIGANPIVPDETMPDVEAAYNFFVLSWIGRNGVSGTKRNNYQIAVRWTSGGGHGGVRFASARESLPAWHRRLQSVVILRRDLFDVVQQIDDKPGTVIYCDPPYLRGTRGSALYEHEFRDLTGTDQEGEDDHARLADAEKGLRSFQHARVVVSYYAHERLERLYPDWTIRQMTRQKNLNVQNCRGAGKCEAPEVLLMNGPSYAEPSAGRLFD